MLKFLFSRVFILSILLSVLVFILSGYKPVAVIGGLAGALLSVYKIRFSSLLLTYLAQDEKHILLKSLFLNLFSQVLTLAVLIMFIRIDLYSFFACAAGLLLTAAVICINGVTERIGLTHNNWNNFELNQHHTHEKQ